MQILLNDEHRAGGSSALDITADFTTVLQRWAQDINSMFSELYAWADTPLTAAFSTTIPLTSAVRMPPQSVTGPLAFSPGASPASGAMCAVVLIADGTHVPTFPGFTQQAISGGSVQSIAYSNIAGTPNTIIFYQDPTNGPMYRIIAALSPWAATLPGLFPSVGVISLTHGVNPVLTIAAAGSGLSPAIAPPPSAFALSSPGGATVQAVTVSANAINLQLQGTINAGDTVTIGYTPPVPVPRGTATNYGAARDTSGNWLAAFGGASVTVS